MWNDFIWLKYFGGDAFTAVRDTHSLYFEVLSEHGFLGFGLYLLILGSTLVNLWQLRRRWRKHPEYAYIANYAEMTQLLLYPYNRRRLPHRPCFDLYFYFVGSSVMLRALSNQARNPWHPQLPRIPRRDVGREPRSSATTVPVRVPRRLLPTRRNRHA
jgi:hypothetical protein